MSEYGATIEWRRDRQPFTDRRYSRAHLWKFDGGAEVPASPSPHVVPAPMSVAAHVDPEEAFVASLASCHMLFFLDLCAQRRFVVDEYTDHAVGLLARNDAGKLAMTRVTLRPRALFSGDSRPSADEVRQLHARAHDLCFIANSVNTEVLTEPA